VIEGAVRHECAHIRVRDFAPRNPSDADILAEERAVWAISDAFDAIGDEQQFAAMVVRQLSTKPNTFSNIAANVRAMVATTAATRRHNKGRNMAMDPATAKMLLDASESEDAAAMKAAIRKIVEDALSGGQDGPPSAQDPNAPPMNQDAGAVDPNKDKLGNESPMMRAMKADLAEIRTMKAELKEVLDVARPAAKVELVRAMRADNITLLPHQEKEIVDAPDLPTAKAIAKGMRAMAIPGQQRKHHEQAAGDAAGLTKTQAATYTRMMNAGNPGAETYRAACIDENKRSGGAK
jgi:hypothetical protein